MRCAPGAPNGWPVRLVPDLLASRAVPVAVADFAAAMGESLRRAGIVVGADRLARLARSLVLIPPTDRNRLYWVTRLSLLGDRAQQPTFDAVFAALFDGMLDPADSRGDTTGPPAIGAEERTRPTARDDRRVEKNGGAPPDQRPATARPDGGLPDSDALDREAVLAFASTERRLRETSFADLTSQEAEQIRGLVRSIRWSTPLRRSGRFRPAGRSGEIDIRRTVRAAQRGGEVLDLRLRRRRCTPRRLILLCDVSASMEPYTRVFLSLLQGAVSGARAEAFIFSTGLTRLTRQLAGREPGPALARAAASNADWAGGTRLADSVREFVAFGRRGPVRGAVVVVLSDGWSLDEPTEVTRQMERLRRLAFRIVWVNPRKAAAGFAPLVGGMAAALPFCDAFVSGHSVAALNEVATAIRGAPPPSRSTFATASSGRTP